jgi:hypothetical protein
LEEVLALAHTVAMDAFLADPERDACPLPNVVSRGSHEEGASEETARDCGKK